MFISKIIFKPSFLLLSCIFLSCITQNTNSQNDFNTDVISNWNEKVFQMAIEEDGLLTLKGVRTAALMGIATHDALNSIEPIYSHYSYKGSFEDASPLAACAQASYEIAIYQFPEKENELKKELHTWLSKIEDSKSKERGIKLGQEASKSIIEDRLNDKWNQEASYTWHPMAPGVYAEFNEHSNTPEGFIFGAGWARSEPFLLKSQDQFRSPPPPDINSDTYTLAFNEVKEYGRYNSESRTHDQAHMALWWKDFVENSHNRLARSLIKSENLNLWDTARTYALLNMTIYDAYINVFNNKFYYNHWRPYTAIRWAANDGNPNTIEEEDWNNLHKHTYAFPSYPSAHGTASTAAMTVLATVLKTGDTYNFTMQTETVDSAGPFSDKIDMDPPTRQFNSFSEAGKEASMSRLYLGIHFRYDSEEGFRLGKEIGDYAVTNFLTPL